MAANVGVGDASTKPCRLFVRQEMFRKILSKSESDGKYRVYVPEEHARMLCPPAFSDRSKGSELTQVGLPFFDHQMNRYTASFRKCGEISCLTGGWSEFGRENKLQEKDTVIFYELSRRGGETGERFIQIEVAKRGC
jgi:hypothetical protein